LIKPIVAIVGRQNVGKSTLLNRIAEKQIAIVEDFPGTTRDRVFADAVWNNIQFTIVDTGGLEFKDVSMLGQNVRKQVEAAIAEADVLIFLTDVKEGLMPADQTIAQIVRKSNKPVVLVVNKVDNQRLESQAAEFYQLGLGEPQVLSGFHGRGVADLLDKVTGMFPPQPAIQEEPLKGISVAIVGHPHVGKSLLLNRLLGKERSIVGETPGTTRDAIDTQLDFEGQNVLLIDTAGIRRKGKVEQGIEWFSVLRAMRALDRADIGLLVIDATEPLTAQDAHIAGYIEKAGKGVAILVNKWDLVTEKDQTEYTDYIRDRLKFAPYAPILYISAKSGQRVNKVMPLVLQIAQERSLQIPDEEVNSLIKEAVKSHNLPHKAKKILELYSARQSATNPPSFRFIVNEPELVHFSYERFLENRLREVYGFNGTPIRLSFKIRGSKP
jgi:GTP-binding protein